MTLPTRRPQAFKLDEVELEQPPPPPAIEAASALAENDFEDTDSLAKPLPTIRLKTAAILVSALAGLFLLSLGLSLDRLLSGLFARADWLGWLGSLLAAIAVIAGLVLIVREAHALLRFRRIRRIRSAAIAAAEADDPVKARAVLAELSDLYRRRANTARARAALAAHAREIIDGRDLIGLGETELLIRFDGIARRMVLASARRVSGVTAMSPRALLNVGFVLVEVVRLVRRLALLYGGGHGVLGFFSLARGVAGHLAVTGGLAAGHTLLQQIVGHGLAARLSARLAEGLINGVLTARVGIAAIEVCRPFPFIVGRPPRLSEVVAELARNSDPDAPRAGKRRARLDTEGSED